MEKTLGGVQVDLSTQIAGINFSNPIMPASGPLTGDDEKMSFLESMGLGGMVTKTISTRAAHVPRPCIVATKSYVLNTELWTEYPVERWRDEFLPRYKENSKIPLLVSLGYTTADLEQLVPVFRDYADAFELSTHYVADDPVLMRTLIKTVKKHTGKPVFLKFDPSVPNPEVMAGVIEEAGGNGIVAMNSLGPGYPLDRFRENSPLGSMNGFGWISGPAIKPLSLALIKRIAAGCSLPIIGVGGISMASDVVEFLMAGASAVQILSAALINGKDIYIKILDELPDVIEELEYTSVSEIIGIASRSNPQERFEKKTPIIDNEKCIGCGLCVKICPYFALVMEDNVVVDESECFGCGLCQSRCPVSAIGGVFH